MKELRKQTDSFVILEKGENSFFRKHKCLANMQKHFVKDCPSLKGFKEVFE